MSDENSRNGEQTDKKNPAWTESAGRLSIPGKTRKPDPERMRILRSLPLEIKQSLTSEEANAFLFENTWPDSLLGKLKDFLVEDDVH
jgi:hypothetical protein